MIAADRQRFCAERGLGLARFAELQAAVEIARPCEHMQNVSSRAGAATVRWNCSTGTPKN
jgi:DNA repair protein RadC